MHYPHSITFKYVLCVTALLAVTCYIVHVSLYVIADSCLKAFVEQKCQPILFKGDKHEVSNVNT
jgi:hypothetical protein